MVESDVQLPFVLCSLVNQVRSIKGLALGGKDEEQAEHLTSILDALTACVSTLHERKHEALLNEVLNIPIWTASPVRAVPSLGYFTNSA